MTVQDCTFTGTAVLCAVQVENGDNTTIENCTFTGTKDPTSQAGVFVNDLQSITLKDNSFIDAPQSAVHIGTGAVVTGNYFAGAGWLPGAHPDAIVEYGGTGISITNNFIDWTNGDNPVITDGPIRIEANKGSVSNVDVSGNFLVGGDYSIDAGNQAQFAGGTFSNISITNNYMGFSYYGALQTYGLHQQGVTASGNVIFDYQNPNYSTQAWAAYQAAGLPAANLVTSTGQTIQNTSSSPTTLYGDGVQGIYLQGGTGETVFVGGAGTQYMTGGYGANIFTYLAISDSNTEGGIDAIRNFNPAKDVIDLSHIDADLTTPGVQNFTFIGAAPFSGDGAQVRYQQDPASNETYVEAQLAGGASSRDLAPDLFIALNGLVTLSAANFALTAAQSSADLAAGAGGATTMGSSGQGGSTGGTTQGSSGTGAGGTGTISLSDPANSTEAWAAYQAAGLPAANLVTSTGQTIQNTSSSPTTLYGDGVQGIYLQGGTGETVFVGGAGTQYMTGGYGANIFTYLAISDSNTEGGYDAIRNFNPAKDVIDLSHIDADLTTPGVQNFTFIGAAPFSGAGAQVRYEQDPASNHTYVEADLAGHSSPDLFISLNGLVTLSAANFALTAAQSSADLAAGATPGATSAQALGAVLAQASSGPSATTTAQSYGDILTQTGQAASLITASPSSFQIG